MTKRKGVPQKKIEILAPAGSLESLKAAVCAGADAVYVGGSRFGARAYADNFGEQELLAAIDYVHLHGRKIYMTVNTLLKDQEVEELYKYLLPYYCQGLDAVNCTGYRCSFSDPGMVSVSWNPYQHTDDSGRNMREQIFLKRKGQKELFRQENYKSGRNTFHEERDRIGD